MSPIELSWTAKNIFSPSRYEFFIAGPLFLPLQLLPTQVNTYKVFQILSPEMTTSWQVCVRLWSSLLWPQCCENAGWPADQAVSVGRRGETVTSSSLCFVWLAIFQNLGIVLLSAILCYICVWAFCKGYCSTGKGRLFRLSHVVQICSS